MALTEEGKALTEANRLAQLGISAPAIIESQAAWRFLQLSDLDGSFPRWATIQLGILRRYYDRSKTAAAAYVREYRGAEIGATAGVIISPAFPTAEMLNVIRVGGPVALKQAIKKGTNPDVAYAHGFDRLSGLVNRQVLAGGRSLVDETTAKDSGAVGWRRVSDGNPCTFCAMLVSRGNVYRSKRTTEGNILRPSRSGGEKLLFHGHCGCTAEIVYGEWIPTETEQRWVDAYDKAAKEADAAGEARTQDTILHRMRRDGDFRDSPKAA